MTSSSIQYDLIFSQLEDTACIILDKEFTVLSVNNRYLENAHIPRDKLLGHNILDVLPPAQDNPSAEGMTALRQSLETAKETGMTDHMPISFHQVLIPETGKTEGRYWQCSHQPVFDEHGELVYILHQSRDVTAQVLDAGGLEHPVTREDLVQSEIVSHSHRLKEQNLKLSESEKRIRAIFRDASLGISIGDMEGRILDANQTFLDMLGYTKEELLQLTYIDISHPDDKAAALERRELISAGKINHDQSEKRYITKSGKTVWVRLSISALLDENGDFESLIAITEDITAKKAAEKIISRDEILSQVANELAVMGGWAVYPATDENKKEEVYWSPGIRRIWEYEKDDIPPLNEIITHYSNDSAKRALKEYKACFKHGKLVDFEANIITYKNNEKWIRVIGQPQLDDKGKVIALIGVIQDITGAKKSEEEKQLINSYLVNTLEYMTDAFYLLDTEWRFLFVNSEAVKILGKSREELIGRSIWKEFPKLKNSEMYEKYYRAKATGQPVHAEFYSDELDEWIETSLYPSPEGLAVYFNITTEKKKLRTEIAESEQRLKYVTQATLDVAWDVNIKEDSIWVSQGINDCFGYSEENTSGLPFSFWREKVHPDDVDKWQKDFRDNLDSGNNEWIYRYRFRRADGTYAHIEDRGFIIRDDNGELVRMVGGTFDITEQLELEEQLRQSQRLESVGKLTGGVAHDFNNLLTIILGNIGLLSEYLANDERIKPLADSIEKATLQGAELTQRLLAFARKQALEPKVVDIASLLEKMLGLLKRTLGEDIDIRIDHPEKLDNVLVDPHQLENALINLCINSRDAMPEGGELVINLSKVSVDGTDYQRNLELQPGKYIHISVSDTGKGIPENMLDRIIEPFFTTKEAGKGTGLGLSTVFGFIKQSKGHMTITSELNKGTTVNLYLPVSRTRKKEKINTDQNSLLFGGDETILVVEDDPMVLSVVENTLKALGYNVITCASGDAALEVLKKEEAIDLLFTDIVMPGKIKGNVLAEKAREIRPDIKVLLTSGYSEEAYFNKDLKDSDNPLLRKPYLLNDLAKKVREVIETVH